MGGRGCTMPERKLSAPIIEGEPHLAVFSSCSWGARHISKDRLRQIRQESRTGEEAEGSVS